ncbi:MAG: autotransporter-associated beta strand repeat-containing protein [Pirellulales bacterium]|nr:autotransporter-associated beta strand repeat-containing protein [Pirellulales bacterium]
MNFQISNLKIFDVANRSRAISFITEVLCAAIFLSSAASMTNAAITWSGDVNPADPTTWTAKTNGSIGSSYTGTVTVDSGSELLNSRAFLGHDPGSTGTVTITGSGSKWTIYSLLRVGYFGSGSLNIQAGGQVNSTDSIVGGNSGSNGMVMVSGIGSMWTNSGDLLVGDTGSGTLTVSDGGTVTVNSGLFASLNSLFGNGVILTNGAVLDVDVLFDATHGLQKTIAFGTNGAINLNQNENGVLGAGYKGNGTVIIAQGIVVASVGGYLGYQSGSIGTATVTGTGSKWNNSRSLFIGNLGNGTLNIEAGGQVINSGGVLGYQYGSSGTATVSGDGSQWINSGSLYVGDEGTGTLNIGIGSGSGGLASIGVLYLGLGHTAKGICNLDGGTLQVGHITRGSGSTNFNWIDGTIRNYDATTNLTIYNLRLKLGATGLHVFNIDSGRTGTVDAILSDATSGGTLEKQGAGLLILTAANTYTGGTTISEGTLALSSTGTLASSLIDVGSGATFDVSAKSGGFTLGTGKTLKGSGTVVGSLVINGIHAPGSSPGIETVRGNYSMLGELQIELMGKAAGTGYDQVLLPVNGTTKYNATLGGILILDWTGMNGSTGSTKLWIVKNDTFGTLSGTFGNYANGAALGMHDGWDWRLWYGADAATGKLFGGNDVVIAAVPEPMGVVLLGIGALLLLGWAWRRR